MEFMDEKFGRGWGGSDDYATYYEDLGSNDDPFSYIKVIPLIGAEAQKNVAVLTTQVNGKHLC